MPGINSVLKHHPHNQMNLTDPGLIGVHRIEVGVYPANVVLIHQSDRLLPNEGMEECIQEVIVQIIGDRFVPLFL